MTTEQKPVRLSPIPPPPPEQRAARGAAFADPGEKRGRYHLPASLESGSPVGYRTRPALTAAEGAQAAALLSMAPPTAFVAGAAPTEGELFDEASLGVLSARQSTNYRGQRQLTVGPEDSAKLAILVGALSGVEAPPPTGAAYGHIALCRPYRTPFTFLLTFVGHKAWRSLVTVPIRAWNKRQHHQDDIPTIGFLKDLHVGIWADAVERAALLASGGARRAWVSLRPFTAAQTGAAGEALREIELLAGLSAEDRRLGWRVCFVALVGAVAEPSPVDPATCRKLGATLLSLRSERIQPGVNAEPKAPPAYQARQDMDVPPELVEMAGRAGYNAFCRWTGVDREAAKRLLLLDRIDVLTPGGKERLREIRSELEAVTDRLVEDLPLWADLPMGKALSKNAAKGRKAFALAGQRIYVGGLSRPEVEAAGLDFTHAVRAFGAAAARSALVCELAGCLERPEGCDLLAGICLMAGPVNQNDIGKQFQGRADLLDRAFAGRSPTSLLVWTLKAKTVADPIGNEEQLMNAAQKGALVDLRAAPHEVVALRLGGQRVPMRLAEGQTNAERAFADVGNFVTDPGGQDIPGNRGAPWPADRSAAKPWG